MRQSTNLSPSSDTPRPPAMTWRTMMPLMLVVAVGCKDAQMPTSPSSTTTTTTTTVSDPTVTEEFTGTVEVGSSHFYSFTVESNGTVNVTLKEMTGTGVPSSVWMGLGIGVPAEEDCATTTTVNGPAGTTPQLSGTYAPSVYCVRIHDIGNLYAAARFAITIAHP